ncbi:MAG: J domain-containing protein [Haloplanus sp.]
MDRDRLLLGLAAVFAGLTAVLIVVSFVRQPFLLVVALPFAATTYLLWQHATGRLADQARRRTRRTTGRGGASERRAPGGFGASAAGRSSAGTGRRTGSNASARPTRAEAYRTLGLDPGADEATVKRAYRAKVKEVHPDTDGGDEEAFKRVNRAYEVLTD